GRAPQRGRLLRRAPGRADRHRGEPRRAPPGPARLAGGPGHPRRLVNSAVLWARALPLPWPFERQYMQLALLAGVLVGTCAPLVGAFLVQKRLSLMGDGIGHIAFAGVSAGLLLGAWPVATALVAAVAGAVVVEWLRSRRAE